MARESIMGERLRILIEDILGISNSEFARLVGMNRRETVDRITSGATATQHAATLARIRNAYPQHWDWLTGQSDTPGRDTGIMNPDVVIGSLRDEVARLRRELTRLRKVNKSLKELLRQEMGQKSHEIILQYDNTILGRIAEIYGYLGLSRSAFAKEVGEFNASGMLNGESEVSEGFVRKILARYDFVNPDWLVCGEGEMMLYDWREREIGNAKPMDADDAVKEICRIYGLTKREVAEMAGVSFQTLVNGNISERTAGRVAAAFPDTAGWWG